MNHNNITYFL